MNNQNNIAMLTKAIAEKESEIAAKVMQRNEAGAKVANNPRFMELYHNHDALVLRNEFGILNQEEADAKFAKIDPDQTEYKIAILNLDSQIRVDLREKAELEERLDWEKNANKPLAVRLTVQHTDSTSFPLYSELFELWLSRGYTFAGELVCSGNVRILTFIKGK